MSKEAYNKIVAKLEKLDEFLSYLNQIQEVNKNTFLKDFHFFGSAERYLQLSIEALIDVGKLIVVSRSMRKPDDTQDIFVVLHENKVITTPLANKLTGIVNFRNILVHVYEKIDRDIVYQNLKQNLSQFKDFKKQILTYVKANF